MGKFGAIFREWRIQKGVTATFIEKRVDLVTSKMSHIEHGRRPPSDNDLRKLASISELEIDFDTLKGWTALDKFTPEQLVHALRAVYPDSTELQKVIKA